MKTLEAIVLGAVQGLSEFLPISSSAHLRVIPSLLGWSDPGTAFSAVIQLGSTLAVITYFAKDLIGLLKGSFTALKSQDYLNHDLRILIGIMVGTIPICLLGLLFRHLLEQDQSPIRSLNVIGCASIVMGLLLFFAEQQDKQSRDLSQTGILDGLLVGLGQALALIPGCSRSGSTLTVALLLGIKRADAAKFSFLLGIPAISLSGLLELKKLIDDGLNNEGASALAIGFLVSTVVSYVVIAWFIKFLQFHSLKVFIIYRLIFGALVLILSRLSIIK
jgi:undecaprenyl-diphosphatase